jgi:hypothetical protein
MSKNIGVQNININQKYITIKTTSGQYYKTFLGVIYATRGVFPYDFD